MDMTETPGWYRPIYHAIASPQTLLLAGVPQSLLLWDVLGTLLVMLFWWPACYLGAAIYVIAVYGTRYEIQWWELWHAYRRYARYYEG